MEGKEDGEEGEMRELYKLESQTKYLNKWSMATNKVIEPVYLLGKKGKKLYLKKK